VGRVLRLRISVADRAGALAQAATVIGLHSGNILSIDVHRNSGNTAIDDLVVEFPDDIDLDDLSFDLVHLQVHVLSHEPAEYHDPLEELLRRLSEWPDDPFETNDAALIRTATQLCAADRAWISTKEEASKTAPGRAALEAREATNQAIVHDDGDDRILAVPLGELGEHVLFLSRSKADEFTLTEISRIQALAALLSGRLKR
jgi:hypothetical protein